MIKGRPGRMKSRLTRGFGESSSWIKVCEEWGCLGGCVLETSKLQLPETVFRLKHMPSIIYRGAHSNFWPALHGTCTLFLVLVELYNADTSTPPLQAAHPSHKASGFTGLHTWVLVIPLSSRIKHPSSNLQDPFIYSHSAMAPTCRKAQGVECTSMQLPWPLDEWRGGTCGSGNYSHCTNNALKI